jgi:AraC family transcriptional regulator
MMQQKTATYYQKKVGDVLQYINNHIGNNLSIKELAEYAGISFFHFHRIMKAALNEPLGSYIDRARLDTAVKLIRYSNEPITNIAKQIGYNDLSSFSKAFSKQFGLSPQEFKINTDIILNTHIDYRIDDNGALISDIKPKIVVVPEKNVIFIRVVGEYGGAEVLKAWEQLFGFTLQNKLLGWKPEFLSIYYDEPDLVGVENCTSDLCFVTNKQVEKNGLIDSKLIKGGKYAVFRYKGAYERLGELYYSIYRGWVLSADIQIRDFPPFEKYINYSAKTKPDDLITDIYIPI